MKRPLFVIALSLLACRPDFAERASLVTETEIVAVRSEPAEAKPGEPVTYTVLVAGPDGPVVAAPASWAFCATPKRLTENGAVSRACLSDGVRPIGEGATASAVLPSDACFLFGPEVSSADLRPRDPDVTGGYYQPVRVVTSGVTAFGATRLRCNAANASAEVAAELQRRYVPNRNPELLPLEADAPLDAVPRGARITLRAAWPPSSVERYVAVDVAAQRLVELTEIMRVSWLATAGSFEHDRTGGGDNAWTAPDAPGLVHVFVVLRDDRGGVAYQTRAIDVR